MKEEIQIRKKRKGFLLRILLSIMLLFFVCLHPAQATSDTKEQMEEAQRKKQEKEGELAEAQQDLQETQADLARLQRVKSGYQGEMNELNAELQLVADHLHKLEVEMDLKQLEIDETIAALEQARITRQEQYDSMKMRIRFLYENGGMAYVDILFSADSFGEFLNFADYVADLSAYDRQMLEEYIQTEHEIEDEEAQLEREMAELESLKAGVVEQQKQVNGLIQKTAGNIAATAENIEAVNAQADAYEQEIVAREQEVADATAEYEAIKRQYEEELRLSRLAAQSKWRNISEVTFEEGDRYLLANLIYCEAGNQPYEGQVAVGAVVINRVLSSRYPDTVTGVIYQRKQFSPVDNGRLANALAVNKATARCYQAADEAMAGHTNVGNCLYFRTPIPGLTGIQIGGHIFY
ncbi:MAG: cell wall hydrolase [Lachnospiraceae bacterium]|nr:cell wall hydrolase [Lachnospiraceae bacterium]